MSRRPHHPEHFDRGAFLAALTVALVALLLSPAVGMGSSQATTQAGNTSVNTTTLPTTAPATSSVSTSTSTTAIEHQAVSFGFENQTSNGTNVTVTAPRLPDGGFIVIHGPTFPRNGLGSIIGVSRYIPANSSFSAVEVPLFENVPGQSFGQQRLRANTTLYAQAVLDTDDNYQFDGVRTNGAQDVTYLVDGTREAVLPGYVSVDQSAASARPTAATGLETTSSALSEGATSASDSDSGSEPETMEIAVGKQNASELGYSSSMLNQTLSGIGGIATLLIVIVGIGVLAYVRFRT